MTRLSTLDLTVVKRRAVIQRLRNEARARGLAFDVVELTRHTAVKVGATSKTLGRHAEVDDLTAHKFWDQFESEFGKGWWR